MIRSGVMLVRASGRIFLEAAPEGLDPQAIGRALVAQEGVVEVHDLHVWEVGSGFPGALRARARGSRRATVTRRAGRWRRCCASASALEHTTLQVDHAVSELLEIAPARRG